MILIINGIIHLKISIIGVLFYQIGSDRKVFLIHILNLEIMEEISVFETNGNRMIYHLRNKNKKDLITYIKSIESWDNLFVLEDNEIGSLRTYVLDLI